MPRKLFFVIPHLRAGGVEHVVREMANRVDREQWIPILILGQSIGEFLTDISNDVRVVDCGGQRAALLPPVLAFLIRKERPDLIYSGTNAMNIAVLLAQKMLPKHLRARHVISEHTTAAAYLVGAKAAPLRRAIIRRLYPDADRLAAPLEIIAQEWTRNLGLKGVETAVLPNPVLDERRLRAVEARRITRRPLYVAAAGRLVPDKGFDILIDAFARLRSRVPEATLDIYGRGPEMEPLGRRIERHGLTGSVRLCGHTGDILGAFAQAQVVALSSRREGFGNVLVEALAVGAGIVATDCPGPREILQGGRHGILVPVGDAARLAQGLEQALGHPPDPTDLEARRACVAPYRVTDAVHAFEALARDLTGPAAQRVSDRIGAAPSERQQRQERGT